MKVKMKCFWILAILLVIEPALSHNHLSHRKAPAPRQTTFRYEIEDEPSSKTLHKIKKLRKKQMLLCLLGAGGGGGRSNPLDSPEARFLFPILQQTEVNVGSPNGGNHLASPYGSGMNCGSLLGSGGGLGALGHPGLLSHPLLSGLGGLGSLGSGSGGSQPTDEDANRYLHFNMKRHVVRPLYKSMKSIYRLFR